MTASLLPAVCPPVRLIDDICSLVATLLPPEDLRCLRLVDTQWRACAASCITSVAPKLYTQLLYPHTKFPDVTIVNYSRQQPGPDVTQLAWLFGFEKLSSLSLELCHRVKNRTLAHLAILPTLHTLNLAGCEQVSWSGVCFLSRLSSLRHLNCFGIRFGPQDEQLPGLPGLLSRLLTLTLGDPDGSEEHCCVGDALLGVVGRHARRLQALDLTGCITITDQGVCSLVALSSSLTSLNLHDGRSSSRGVRLTYACLPAVCRLTALTSLDLSGCKQLGDTDVLHLAVLTGLRSLTLQRMKFAFTGAGLASLTTLTLLATLSLRRCHALASLAAVGRLVSLTDLDVSQCHVHSCALVELPHLSSCTRLQRLFAAELCSGRSSAAPAADAAATGLTRLALALGELQTLDLSHFVSGDRYGLPAALLADIAQLTALTHLDLADSEPAAAALPPPQQQQQQLEPTPLLPPAHCAQPLFSPSAAPPIGAPPPPLPCAMAQPGCSGATWQGHMRGNEDQAAAAAGTHTPVPPAHGGQSGLWYLAGLSHLRSLNLCGWTHTAAGELAWTSHLSRLETLRLDGFSNGAGMDPALPSPMLVCQASSLDRHLVSLAVAHATLRELHLNGCIYLGDAGVALLATHLSVLELLSLEGCVRLRGTTLGGLVHCPRLHTLYLRGCEALTDEGVQSLAAVTFLRRLYVDLKGKGLTSVGISALTGMPCRAHVRLSDIVSHSHSFPCPPAPRQ